MRYQVPKLVALDSDDAVLAQVARVAGSYYTVIQVRNPKRAIALVEEDPQVRVFVTEQVMRGADGVELLESIRTMRPEVRRVMVTTYTDLASIVIGLHSGAIQCLVQKPVDDRELLAAVCPQMVHEIGAMAQRVSA